MSSYALLAPVLSSAQEWLCRSAGQNNFYLNWVGQKLTLCLSHSSTVTPLAVEFTRGTLRYRQRHCTLRHEPLARAVGIKGGYRPTVIDATAGLGRDSFILATLGCHVQMIERHPVVAALLINGLQRAYQDHDLCHWLPIYCRWIGTTPLHQLASGSLRPDVIYLDPMFPVQCKRALAKRELQLLQQLVGYDEDTDLLFSAARAAARMRVVVKRASTAPPLAGVKPHATIRTKRLRFDLYINVNGTR